MEQPSARTGGAYTKSIFPQTVHTALRLVRMFQTSLSRFTIIRLRSRLMARYPAGKVLKFYAGTDEASLRSEPSEFRPQSAGSTRCGDGRATSTPCTALAGPICRWSRRSAMPLHWYGPYGWPSGSLVGLAAASPPVSFTGGFALVGHARTGKGPPSYPYVPRASGLNRSHRPAPVEALRSETRVHGRRPGTWSAAPARQPAT